MLPRANPRAVAGGWQRALTMVTVLLLLTITLAVLTGITVRARWYVLVLLCWRAAVYGQRLHTSTCQLK